MAAQLLKGQYAVHFGLINQFCPGFCSKLWRNSGDYRPIGASQKSLNVYNTEGFHAGPGPGPWGIVTWHQYYH